MKHVLVTVYVLSIVTIAYRVWMVERRKGREAFAWVWNEGDLIDWLAIAFVFLCPVFNTIAAIMALMAIYEDDDEGESK